MIWLLVPTGTLVIALFVAALRRKRAVTSTQFADQLERHLLGTEGKWDWDDVTSVALADKRLERIRLTLSKFDSLSQERDRDELKAIITALRRGEFPDYSDGSDR